MIFNDFRYATYREYPVRVVGHRQSDTSEELIPLLPYDPLIRMRLSVLGKAHTAKQHRTLSQPRRTKHSGYAADAHAMAAEILDSGGHAHFAGLYRVSDGSRVAAQITVDRKGFGYIWEVLDHEEFGTRFIHCLDHLTFTHPETDRERHLYESALNHQGDRGVRELYESGPAHVRMGVHPLRTTEDDRRRQRFHEQYPWLLGVVHRGGDEWGRDSVPVRTEQTGPRFDEHDHPGNFEELAIGSVLPVVDYPEALPPWIGVPRCFQHSQAKHRSAIRSH